MSNTLNIELQQQSQQDAKHKFHSYIKSIHCHEIKERETDYIKGIVTGKRVSMSSRAVVEPGDLELNEINLKTNIKNKNIFKIIIKCKMCQKTRQKSHVIVKPNGMICAFCGTFDKNGRL
ncbi:hypothetical protein QLL95_gp0265 [Cotonvirus japonicus]|uniref:Uncharacterized protein n=1 Tax=Cotonvirus japonicus TaxID=2811091 RepID=A0ABM7NRI2_9VIRU|nr:hypothetical protein QLL95_gp0265 [Cotonvirus japonicus]BCS82754.1 hypothetical protein [Cotonvirus japonicus]